jgi:hypothetical protein
MSVTLVVAASDTYIPVFSLRDALVAVFFTIIVMVPRPSGIRTEGETLYSVIVTVGTSAAETGRTHAVRMSTAMSKPELRDSRNDAGFFGIFLFFETDDKGIVMHETPNRFKTGIGSIRCITQSY